MTTAQLFQVAVIPFALLFQIGTSVAFHLGCCSPWLARNAARFATVVWFLYAAAEWTRPVHAVLDMTCAALGAFRWNFPRDDQGPPRRRRKKKVEEKRDERDWTGMKEASV